MSNPLPSMPPGQPVAAVESSSSLLDRLSNWVSENKAVVYTIAGVAVVVTGAGAVYYLNSSVRDLVHLGCVTRASSPGASQVTNIHLGSQPKTTPDPSSARRSAASARRPSARPPIQRRHLRLRNPKPPSRRATRTCRTLMRNPSSPLPSSNAKNMPPSSRPPATRRTATRRTTKPLSCTPRRSCANPTPSSIPTEPPATAP